MSNGHVNVHGNVNLSHSLQRILHNTPIHVAVNETTSSVVTSGGAVFQSGLISNKIQHSFKEIMSNQNIVGHVVDIQSTDDVLYLLNDAGSVFAYYYNSGECSPVIKEVYSPTICGGDPAVKIKSGKEHLVILTKHHKVFGVGSNEEYQLVPQGQCEYDVATELLITDTNVHDNCNPCSFVGTLNELNKPCLPKEQNCGKVTCIKKKLECVKIGELNIKNVTNDTSCEDPVIGTLSIPVYADLSYVGFLCIDDKCISGNLTYTIENSHIKEGCILAKFVENCGPTHPLHLKIKLTSTDAVYFEEEPFTEVVQINKKKSHGDLQCGKCCDSDSDSEDNNDRHNNHEHRGENGRRCDYEHKNKRCEPSPERCEKKRGNCHKKRDHKQDHDECDDIFKIKINSNIFNTVTVTPTECGIRISSAGFNGPAETTSLVSIGDNKLTICEESQATFDLEYKIKLDCCEPVKMEEPKLPQPCWMSIYAGFNTTVLVDSCNRMYVLGSIHEVRNNANLLKRSCLEELLAGADASISLPASQLNCGVDANNTNCVCVQKSCKKPFKTDLSKFGINLRFPNQDECECKTNNVCDFLKALQQCNESPECDNTCEPCDSNIYLNVFESCENNGPVINSITVLNKKSVCKTVSQRCADIVKICLTPETVIEYDLNHYCVDGEDFSLHKTLVLYTGASSRNRAGADITIYVDLDRPGSILFSCIAKSPIVEFVVDASTDKHQFILNYGDILDPVELTNLKAVLVDSCAFPCAQYKNPFCTKVFNTYLKGGDCVNFYKKQKCGIKLAITADVPTVFRLNRRVLDIGVGNNNLSVLVGGHACPNEIFAIGQNCYGQLGLDSFESAINFQKVNRCLFDCQVNAIFSGATVNMYVTQSGKVFGSGLWKHLVNSTIPVNVSSIKQAWKTKQIAISKNQMLILSGDSCLFGLGDNSLGELGLCNIDCVPAPVPIEFFSELNYKCAGQLLQANKHPLKKECKSLYKNDCNEKSCCDDCDDKKHNKHPVRNNANQRAVVVRRGNGRY